MKKRKRRLTRGEIKKQRKRIILSITLITLLFSVGYAAFQTTVNVSVTGSTKYKSADFLKRHTVTTGEGLYSDPYENGRYIYRGENPNNWITFNNELWRIISIESDGTLKIIRNESIGQFPFDEPGNRDSNTSTFCTEASTYGCSAWAANNNLVGNPEIFGTYRNWSQNPTYARSGTVQNDSTLNTYLNNTYYNSINDKGKMISGNFYVGSPGNYNDTDTIENNLKQEKEFIWNGFIGLTNVTEWLQACTNSACTTTYSSYQKQCYTNNWLVNSFSEWTISPESNGTYYMFKTTNYSLWGGEYSYKSQDVRPIIFLKSGLKFKNKGTKENPYTFIS